MLLRPRLNHADPLRIGLANYNLNRLTRNQLETVYRQLAGVYRLPLLYNGYTRAKIIELIMSNRVLNQIFKN